MLPGLATFISVKCELEMGRDYLGFREDFDLTKFVSSSRLTPDCLEFKSFMYSYGFLGDDVNVILREK